MTDKPSLSIADQARRLRDRGMLDADRSLVRALVSHGYFRLSGYWRYFRPGLADGDDSFAHGTDFSQVMAMYQDDADLRNLLLEGIAELEVALRSAMVAYLCVPGGSGTEYLDPSTYGDRVDAGGTLLRDRLLRDLADDIARSKERHVRHHRTNGPGRVPLWVATEAMSFGTLSRMYGLLADTAIRGAVAKRFGYDGGLTSSLATNLRSVSVFRNVCAHHGRVWNRVIHHDKPRLFTGLTAGSGRPSAFATAPWGVILVLAHFVAQVRRDDSFMRGVERLVGADGPFRQGLLSPDRR